MAGKTKKRYIQVIPDVGNRNRGNRNSTQRYGNRYKARIGRGITKRGYN